MIAFGRLASISATGIDDGTISLNTLHSRTRRAMSWAYCAPKSTTRTVSGAAAGFADDTGCLPAVSEVCVGLSLPGAAGPDRGRVRLRMRTGLDTPEGPGILLPCSRRPPSCLPMPPGPPAAMVVLLEQLTSDFPGAPGRQGPGRLGFSGPCRSGAPTPPRSHT